MKKKEVRKKKKNNLFFPIFYFFQKSLTKSKESFPPLDNPNSLSDFFSKPINLTPPLLPPVDVGVVVDW
jgi:hypothetical protein